MTNKFNFVKSALVSASLILPSIVFAAGSATVELEDGNTASIQWLDEKNVRFNMPDTKDYLLSRDGKIYVVSHEDGDLMVLEMGGIAQMAMAFAGEDSLDKIMPDAITKVVATGETETIAGIKGEVYLLTIKDEDGEDEIEVVLTDNKLSNELTDVYLSLIENLVGKQGINGFDQLPKNKRGILRLDNEIKVTSLSDKTPDEKDLELPAEPLNMQNLMQDLQKMMQSLE